MTTATATVTAAYLATLTIGGIAWEIRRDWKRVYFGAVPYLEAMGDMSSIEDSYGFDTGRGIVTCFLANANTYRGDTARLVKAELKARLKRARKAA
jgi:hypothetical protein